jgi:hypothetical protein
LHPVDSNVQKTAAGGKVTFVCTWLIAPAVEMREAIPEFRKAKCGGLCEIQILIESTIGLLNAKCRN